jgi:DNA-binding CsgD family transcriptional regulator
MEVNKREYCFTIMPFRGYFDNYYVKVYKKAIEEAGLHPLRTDDLNLPSTIINDIWDSIQKSKIILADLTGQNANVFYELGLAHASSKPVILIAQSIEDIPFDLRALRIIIYDKNMPDWGEDLRNDIVNAIRDTLKAPLKTILPTFLNVVKSEDTFVSENDKILLELKSEIESLRSILPLRQNPRFNNDNNYTISNRELDVLRLIAKGMSGSEIADTLFINVRTVETHRKSLLEKLDAKNTAQLIHIAVKHGIIDLY